MKTLAFLGQKGGSGKTTLAVHTAVAAQESGEQVVIIDTDIRIPIDPNPLGKELRQLVIRIQTDEPVRHFIFNGAFVDARGRRIFVIPRARAICIPNAHVKSPR